MKRFFYILLFLSGLKLNAQAQVKSDFLAVGVIKTVRCYPNPAVSSINFEFKDADIAYSSLLIFNFIGKKVLEIKVLEQKIVVPLTDFYRGVYIFQVRDKQGNVLASGKFQVAK